MHINSTESSRVGPYRSVFRVSPRAKCGRRTVLVNFQGSTYSQSLKASVQNMLSFHFTFLLLRTYGSRKHPMRTAPRSTLESLGGYFGGIHCQGIYSSSKRMSTAAMIALLCDRSTSRGGSERRHTRPQSPCLARWLHRAVEIGLIPRLCSKMTDQQNWARGSIAFRPGDRSPWGAQSQF